MNIINISIKGISNRITLEKVEGQRGDYHVVNHGEDGRGRWRYSLPLKAGDFSVSVPSTAGMEFSLIDLGKEDQRGNKRFLLGKGEDEGNTLVLLSLNPGFRGSATYKVAGQATVVAEGEEAQGAAGRMGGAMCPIILVEGPCNITWSRSGRLYGGDSEWVASYNGEEWDVYPDSGVTEDDIFGLK